VKESFNVFATPEVIARQICDAPSFEDGVVLYKSYMGQYTDSTWHFNPNDPTLRIGENGDLVGDSGVLCTVGASHVLNLELWIASHQGWDVYWEYF
jgi:hypothetical protein